ncbi:DNA-3-methyladenine glycosylase family protein [Aquibacillus kalidii]|uniref:DNA-3-methyladenine glycosylase family protein n=1 Tax=Aquibacillus kalidii TaxID=2762597 RepID=UPI0016459190|nr:DNA-3-methyladenine glycosylase [Aquibacillus kalidii]
MWTKEIELDFTYDFDYVLRRLAMDPLNTVNLELNKVHIPIQLNTDKHVIEVESRGSTDKPSFVIKSNSRNDKESLLDIVVDIFLWNRNLNDITKHFKQTNLASLFELYPGTPVVKDWDLYQSIIKTIIHQQLNMSFAHTLTKRFVEKYGERRQGVWFYPDPETVANIPYQSLQDLQFSRRKAEYVIDLSRLVVNGELSLEELSEKEDQEIIKSLVAIRGVGNWTAENWLLFGLGRSNLLPKTDIGVQNALKRYFNREKKPDIREIESWGEQWSPFRSYATQTIWRSIEEEKPL